ncbi:hypothetical protein BRC94_11835 [Halobacteriales archaeon QS_5_70_17]|nr:MAG: hypothetical protein BRC94_11835 [Halobacteriales archaeon QS_5_70_17]
MERRERERDPGHGTFVGQLSDAYNVLLRSSSIDWLSSGACVPPFLPEDREVGDVDLIAVSYTRTGTEWSAAWEERLGTLPGRSVIVGVDDAVRESDGGRSDVVETNESPDDLTGIGITLSEYLSSWGCEGGDLVVCFDSLTALLQYVSLQRAYRFLHVLTGRAAAVGARSHYHLDPGAHDDRTVATLTSLFDAVVDESGAVRTR